MNYIEWSPYNNRTAWFLLTDDEQYAIETSPGPLIKLHDRLYVWEHCDSWEKPGDKAKTVYRRDNIDLLGNVVL